MKVTVNKKEPAFEPVTFTIELTSLDELVSMWHRTNFALSSIRNEYKTRYGLVNSSFVSVSPLWDAIDKELEDRGCRL